MECKWPSWVHIRRLCDLLCCDLALQLLGSGIVLDACFLHLYWGRWTNLWIEASFWVFAMMSSSQEKDAPCRAWSANCHKRLTMQGLNNEHMRFEGSTAIAGCSAIARPGHRGTFQIYQKTSRYSERDWHRLSCHRIWAAHKASSQWKEVIPTIPSSWSETEHNNLLNFLCSHCAHDFQRGYSDPLYWI